MVVPDRVESILDVGCGNGDFLATFDDSYKKTGIDVCIPPLRQMRCPAVAGSVDALPVKSLAFDMVTCFEVLEHLPHGAFQGALRELQRICRKYLVVTVPNRQNLDQSLVKCPECSCRYNPDWHVRSFDRTVLASLFRDFRCSRLEECGPVTEDYPDTLNVLFSLLYGRPPPIHGVCPQCGLSSAEERTDAPDGEGLARTSSRWNAGRWLVSRLRIGKRPYWLRASYERVTQE